MTASITVLESIQDFKELGRLNSTIFGLGPEDQMPASELRFMTKIGGIGLLAHSDGQAVGFLYAVVGMYEGKPYLESVATGVLEPYRGQGIERQIKIVERQIALERGFDIIRWSFSALRAPNARVFLSRLGGISHSYGVDTFEGMGFGTREGNVVIDEWYVEWHLRSQRVVKRLAGELPGRRLNRDVLITRTHRREDGLLVLDGFEETFTEPRVLVEVPEDVQTLIEYDEPLAIDWRMKTRDLFLGLLDQRYTFTECVSEIADGQRRNFFLFERDYLLV